MLWWFKFQKESYDICLLYKKWILTQALLLYLEKQKPFRPEYTPVHSDTPFAKETTHNVDYTEKPLPEHFRRTVEEYKPSSAEFDGRTTYRINYIPLEGERAKMIKPAYQALDRSREFSVRFVYSPILSLFWGM